MAIAHAGTTNCTACRCEAARGVRISEELERYSKEVRGSVCGHGEPAVGGPDWKGERTVDDYCEVCG